MKTTRNFKLTNIALIGPLLIAMVFLFTSCEKKIPFDYSNVVPAAKGSVYIKGDKNHNYVIKIRISNLANVDRLEPYKETYVVWIVTDKDQVINVGQLNSSTRFLSKQLNANFETVTSFKPARVFISAERSGDIQSPGELIMLTTNNF